MDKRTLAFSAALLLALPTLGAGSPDLVVSQVYAGEATQERR
jgi:hypothetical protein